VWTYQNQKNEQQYIDAYEAYFVGKKLQTQQYTIYDST
jgi:hypothetical protein